jgi:dynein light intermediate chain 2
MGDIQNDAGPVAAAAGADTAACKDIWTILREKRDADNIANAAGADGADGAATTATASSSSQRQREAACVFVGSRRSGKSTLIHSYMFKDKEGAEPKPTTALDYKYIHSSAGISMTKDLSHFWELGGGRTLQKLLDVPLSGAKIEDAMILIVVDLSRPWRVLSDAQHWFQYIRGVIGDVQQQLKKSPETQHIPAALAKQSQQAFGADHADRTRVNLMPLPVVLVANKYDKFKDSESQLLKVMSKALRHIAHMNGASLMYASRLHKTLGQAFRSRVSRHVLDKAVPALLHVEHTKPLMVAAGSDSLQEIGSAVTAAEFAKFFPVNEADTEDSGESKLQLDPEPRIDSLLLQREEDLKRLQREIDLKRKIRDAEQAEEKQKASQLESM